MIRVREYEDRSGKNQYRAWFNDLDIAAAVKVTTAVERIAQGNTSSFKPVGEGVAEYRIDWGPGYRVYLGQDGDTLVILLGGGTKKRTKRRHRKSQSGLAGIQATEGRRKESC